MRSIGFNFLVREGFRSITLAIAEMAEKVDNIWDIIINPVKKVFNLELVSSYIFLIIYFTYCFLTLQPPSVLIPSALDGISPTLPS